MSDDLKRRLIDWEMWDYGDINDTREEAHAYIEELEAQNKRLRDQMKLYHISVEALSEIKASVDGKSDQPVVDIIYGLLDEIAKVKKNE
jgi:plasmid stabilization system protein ParE